MTAEIFFSTTDLQKQFRHVRALNGVSIEARQGNITAIVGDNGSGKSTLIKLLAGNLKPDGGSITIGGRTYRALSIRQSLELGIRTVYQDLSLDNCKNSAENVFLGDELMRGLFLDSKAMLQKTAELLERIHVHIPDLTEPVGNLSGGQRQGIAIARALRRPGRILLLDEPTAAMGIQESFKAMEMLKSLRRQGMTQLIISHNLPYVYSLADYVYVMRAGKILASASPGALSLDELQNILLAKEEAVI